MRAAVLGAGGFIGTRLVESLHLLRIAEVRPVVRRVQSMAGLCRFDLDVRVSDACDANGLATAFAGCDVVIHSAHGELNMVEGSIAPTYRAANKAGVRRLIYLSSASVHGQAPVPGTDEHSRLDDRQVFDYNNQKIRAERRLMSERRLGQTEVVILRPGVVFGPRDRWVTGIVRQLQEGRAYLVNEGKGICNSIYVDNLVDAIQLAIQAEGVDGEAFLVGDRETMTWKDFYEQVAMLIDADSSAIQQVSPPKATRARLIERVRNATIVQMALPSLPGRLKRAGKGFLAGLDEPVAETPWAVLPSAHPHVTEEMASLHMCAYKLPFRKASSLLNYEPRVDIEEGLRRTVAWLKFAHRV